MLVKDVVKKMTREFNAITKKPEKINPRFKKNVELVSQLAVEEMRVLLGQYATSEAKANAKTLAPFINQIDYYLTSLVENTNAIAPFNPKTHANQLYQSLAHILSSYVDVPALKLFWPKLQLTDKPFESPLDRMVPSDDNRTFIDVLEAFEIGRNKKIWAHTHPVDNNQQLSETEKARLINFTAHTARYYQEITAENQPSARKMNKAKNDMMKNLGYTTVLATYGELGEARLAERLYPNVNEMDQKDLFGLLSQHPAHMRGQYLDGLNDKLKKIALNGKSLEEQIGIENHYTGSQKRNTAIMFLWLDIYLRDLKARTKDYNTLFGWVSGLGIAKPYKVIAANTLYDLMLKGVGLSELKQKAIDVITANEEISDNDRVFALRSLDQGTLGLWVTQAAKVAAPKVQAAAVQKEVPEEQPTQWYRRIF